MASDLRFLPPDLAARSLSADEIVLPYAEAVRAIDHLARTHVRILGWEGWVQDHQGHVGHPPGVQGTAAMDTLSPSEAAAVCRGTIEARYRAWRRAHPDRAEALHFCITVAAG